MRTRSFVMVIMALTLGMASLHAYGWTCSTDISGSWHWSNFYDDPPSGWPCGTFSCDREYHWVVRWLSSLSCEGYVIFDTYSVGNAWWGDNQTLSLPKSSHFGDACLAGIFCPRCEDSTSTCNAYDFKAYCCW